jgi:hypothetical protein
MGLYRREFLQKPFNSLLLLIDNPTVALGIQGEVFAHPDSAFDQS